MWTLSHTHRPHSNGFTLIELMVSVAIFAIVMVISVGTLLALVDANKRAQALKSVMDNLNFALENMSRNMRVGYDYHCQSDETPSSDIDSPQDCPLGGVLLAIESQNGDPGTGADQYVYRFRNNSLERSTDGGYTFIEITAAEVVIEDFKFYVTGSNRGDGEQPRVVMTIKGKAGVTPKVQTEFSLQTTVTQRLLDI